MSNRTAEGRAEHIRGIEAKINRLARRRNKPFIADFAKVRLSVKISRLADELDMLKAIEPVTAPA